MCVVWHSGRGVCVECYVIGLESVSEISSPRWSSVYECQSVECAFTSPVIIEFGMLVMFCRQFVMSVSVVCMVSWCGVSWCYVYVGLLQASDQHGFRTGHSATSALIQLTSDVATGFNQRKPPHRTVCVAVDLTAAFDTVNHNALLSKIAKSTLPDVTCRWLSNYIRGRQSVTSCRCVESKDKENPQWRSARLEVFTHAIQFLHS